MIETEPRVGDSRVIEVEAELSIPNLFFKKLADDISSEFKLEAGHLKATKTLDRFFDTDDQDIKRVGGQIRLRQKLDNIYQGNEYRITLKNKIEDDPLLFKREERRLKVFEKDFGRVYGFLTAYSRLLTGKDVYIQLLIDTSSQEIQLGPAEAHLHLDYDLVVYIDPSDEDRYHIEYILEVETHGCPEEGLRDVVKWIMKTHKVGVNPEPKYPRGLQFLNLIK